MSLVETIGKYYTSKAAIFTAFETDGYYEIENHIGHDWHFSGDYIRYYMDEAEYSFDYANQIGEVTEGIYLYLVQDNGEKFYVLFDKECKLTDEEAEEKFDW